MACARGQRGADRRCRGTAGLRPQPLEPEQPARAILGRAHASAAGRPRDDLRPALVMSSLPAADGHHHQRHPADRADRERRPLPRPARQPLRPLPLQAARRPRLRRHLPQQPVAGDRSLPPDRAGRARRAERVPGHRPRPCARDLLHGAQPGEEGRLLRALRRRSTCSARSRPARVATSPNGVGARTSRTRSRAAGRLASRSTSWTACCSKGGPSPSPCGSSPSTRPARGRRLRSPHPESRGAARPACNGTGPAESALGWPDGS